MATNRRSAMKGGIQLLGAAIGIGATGGELSAKTVGQQNTAGGLVVLHGRNWRISSQDLQRGMLPTPGIRMLAKGELIDRSTRGRKIGDFFATYYRLNAPGKAAPDEPGSLEVHTFVFPDGTIVGTGIAPAEFERAAEFAITGGTGRYHGVKGSYAARQSYVDLGGDGKATFTLKLI